MKLYGCIFRMDNGRLTKQIFNHKNKNIIQWLRTIKQDMQEIGITDEVTQNRGEFRKLIKNYKGFWKKENARLRHIWNEEIRK